MPLSAPPEFGYALASSGGPVSASAVAQPTFPRTIKLDINGDFDVSGGTLHLLAGGDSIVQGIKIALQFFKGEWFADLDAGVPYFQEVLVKVPNPDTLQSIFRKAIQNVVGVKSIESLVLTLDRASRKLAVAFSVSTDYGPLTGQVSV